MKKDRNKKYRIAAIIIVMLVVVSMILQYFIGFLGR
jgi:predicted nucleic acid-binding Zn ribbon protein